MRSAGLSALIVLILFPLVAPAAPGDADLELAVILDEAFPTAGEEITANVDLTNQGPATATGVEVTVDLGPGLSVSRSETHRGLLAAVNGEMLLWEIGRVDPAETVELTLTLVASPEIGQTSLRAEVTRSDQPDPDSTPGNGVVGEDDLVERQISIFRTETSVSLTNAFLIRPVSTETEIGPLTFGISSSISVNLIISGVILDVVTQFSESGLRGQSFAINTGLGAIDVAQQLSFTPTATPGQFNTNLGSSISTQLSGLTLANSLSWQAQSGSSQLTDTISVSGTTEGGLTISSDTVLGKDSASPTLHFQRERVSISGLNIGGIDLQNVVTAQPQIPVSGALSVGFGLMEDVQLSTALDYRPFEFRITGVSVSATRDPFVLALSFDDTLELISAALSANIELGEGAVLRTSFSVAPPNGPNAILGLSASLDPVQFSAFAVFQDAAFRLAGFNVGTTIAGINLSAGATFTTEGMEAATLSSQVGFNF